MPNEEFACICEKINPHGFNPRCMLPYGLTTEHVKLAMIEFTEFLNLINGQLFARQMPRFERFLMEANFSSIVGEFMNATIPKHCNTLVKNNYHNGHPDLIPKGHFVDDKAQHEDVGIEIKGSRHGSGWQGHNPEDVNLMVFHFDSDTPKKNDNMSFRFVGVYMARLTKDDWSFSGRNGTSRRTITASVIKSGLVKMKTNWVYMANPPKLPQS